MASKVVQFIASQKRPPSLGSIYIQLHVKPGAHQDREGITSVTETAVNLCVSAQAREGEANKAVIRVLSETLKVPKLKLQLCRGLKSKDKTVVLADIGHDGKEYADSILQALRRASGV